MSSAPTTRNPILWGAYLACSWTWCIGMFLPALLLRDMGWAGFWIFALPNVAGAAAMGWVLRSKIDSVRFVETHPTAVWWFSAITLGFHLFWILWFAHFIRTIFQIPNAYLYGVLGILVVFTLVSWRAISGGRMPQLALALLVLGLGVLIATFFTPDVKEANAALFATVPESAAAPLWMFPVMVFGFVLCPYLDITFHHARQQLDGQRNARIGFTIGFTFFFACMIVLTTRYAGVIVGALNETGFISIATPWLAAGILAHILCQWVFTVRVHLDRIRTLPNASAKQPVLIALILFSGLTGLFAARFPSHAGLTGGEMVYRTFLSAYGLVFPAYMLYRVVVRGPAILNLRWMWISVTLAAPMFWLGFMERQAIWLIPGLGLVLLGAIILRTRQQKS